MPRPNAILAAQQFRSQLAAQEAAAAQRMGRIYAQIYQSQVNELRALAEQLAGLDEIKPSQIIKYQRTQALLKQIEEQAARFGVVVQGEIANIQRDAIEMGVNGSLKLMEASLPPLPPAQHRAIVGSFNRLHADAIEAMAGLLGPDSPLNERLQDAYGQYVASQVESHMLRGIAAGQNPRTIARLLNKNVLAGLGNGLTSALTTVRTAQIKSYQIANHATYAANSDIVPRWVWHSALDGRTCMSCVNQHGKEFPVTETLNDHHNGRCAAIPKTITYRDLGLDIDEPVEPIQRGEDWFKAQPEATQRAMMGRGKWEAWNADKFKFEDLTTKYQDDVYGELLREQTLKKLL